MIVHLEIGEHYEGEYRDNGQVCDHWACRGFPGETYGCHGENLNMRLCVSFVEASVVFTTYLQFDLHALLLLVVGFMLVNLLCCCWGTGFGRP